MNFGNHESSHIVIPDVGMTLIVGENGSGKSMIGEAITWCLWGETIRTTRRGWSPASPGASVSLLLGERVYDRKLNKSGGRFTIDGKGTTRDNNTEVRRLLGSAKLYLSTRVFHRSLLVKFSNATDSERKAIIEYLLGASEFDVWLQQTKEEQRELGPEFIRLTRQVNKLRSQIAFHDGQLAAFEAPKKPKKSKAVKEAEKFLKAYKPIEVPLEPPPEAYEKARTHKDSSKWELRTVEKEMQRCGQLMEEGKCPTCGRATKKVMESQLVELTAKRIAIKLVYEKACETFDREGKAYAKLVDAHGQLRKEAHEQRQQKARAEYVLEAYELELDEYKQVKRSFKKAKREAEKNLGKLVKKKRTLMTRWVSLESRMRRLGDLMKIYGPRGARVDLLREAFEVLGEVATNVARELYKQRVEIEVRPSDDLERFTLRVTIPDGRDISYRGLSEGERSLVDFSLLKALAAVPRTSTGAERLPLCYDDIFDAIDEGNRDRVSTFIRNEARTQGVIVFSHDDTLLDVFTDATCYKVVDGKVEKV